MIFKISRCWKSLNGFEYLTISKISEMLEIVKWIWVSEMLEIVKWIWILNDFQDLKMLEIIKWIWILNDFQDLKMLEIVN